MLSVVSGVQWSPTYELHATTENGKPSPSVTLQYRARVQQSTGEDWTNTGLTLNTVSSDLFDKQIPRLRPVKLTPARGPFGVFPGNQIPQKGFRGWQPQLPQPSQVQISQYRNQAQHQQAQVHQQHVQSTASGGGLFGSVASAPEPTTFGSVPEDVFEEISIPAPITEPSSFVAETPIAISYSITGESTIPSDGVEHQVSVAVLPFDAKISYVTIPRIDPRVYLQVKTLFFPVSRMVD